jgi:tetratricopeptide (TPR) repeat protein
LLRPDPFRAARRLAVAAALAGFAAGCAGIDRGADVQEFAAGRYASARSLAEARASEGGPDQVLELCLAGTAALAEGDVESAHRYFEDSFTDLEDMHATTAETAGAIAGPERSKRWKGDPHERCMNAYYLGVTKWLRGDVDNAAAAFKTGLLRDAGSVKGEAQSDFAALWFLLGMAQREARHEDRGAQALARARELLPENPWTDPAAAADANVLLVVDVGIGPQKVPTGHHGSEIQFLRQPYATVGAEVSESGRSLGRSAVATDVFTQAVTRGSKNLDTVNKSKAVIKDASVIGGAVLADNAGSRTSQNIGIALVIVGLLLPAEADVRSWVTLPGEIQVWTGRLPAGEHVLRVEPQDSSGRGVVASQEIRVTVRDGHVAFGWLRAGPPPSAAPAGAVE